MMLYCACYDYAYYQNWTVWTIHRQIDRRHAARQTCAAVSDEFLASGSWTRCDLQYSPCRLSRDISMSYCPKKPDARLGSCSANPRSPVVANSHTELHLTGFTGLLQLVVYACGSGEARYQHVACPCEALYGKRSHSCLTRA